MLKLLVLFPRSLWTRKVSPARRHSIDAIAKLASVMISGQEWPEYDCTKSVNANLDRIMPDADAVLWYKPDGSQNRFPALIAPERCRVPTIMRFNEAWWPDGRAAREVTTTNTSIVVIHHEVDRPQFVDVSARVEHIPHGASHGVFWCGTRHIDRPIDVLLTGVLSKEIYPLRERFAKLIRSGSIPGEIRNHPGYRKSDQSACNAEVRSYAEHLGRAKIVLVCSSVYRYPLAKYVEAAMAGCLVIGDLPHEPPPGFASFVVNVDSGMGDDRIADLILEWVEYGALRQATALRGQEIVATDYSQKRYAERFIEIVEEEVYARKKV